MPRRLKDTYHKIGELLVRRNLAAPEVIDEALAIQRAALSLRKKAPRLGQILVERKVLTRGDIREILEKQRLGRGEKGTLRIGLREERGVAVVTLDGRVDAEKIEALTRILERLMNRGFARIAVDCHCLVHLGSHGVSSFVSYVDEARARGGDLKFFGAGPDTRLVFERLGLSRFVQIFEARNEALDAFGLPIDEYMSKGALAEYVSGQRTRFFHLSYCRFAQALSDEERLYYESKWHAREGGKFPCKRCKP